MRTTCTSLTWKTLCNLFKQVSCLWNWYFGKAEPTDISVEIPGVSLGWSSMQTSCHAILLEFSSSNWYLLAGPAFGSNKDPCCLLYFTNLLLQNLGFWPLWVCQWSLSRTMLWWCNTHGRAVHRSSSIHQRTTSESRTVWVNASTSVWLPAVKIMTHANVPRQPHQEYPRASYSNWCLQKRLDCSYWWLG